MHMESIGSQLRTLWIVVGLVTSAIVPVLCEPWTQLSVKNTTLLGPQLTPDVTNVSRDGGYSALINDNIVWLYDDTECMGYTGNQLSFISNTAAVADPNQNISTVKDFGVVMVGSDSHGRKEYAILANDTVGTGGWIPFQPDELQFNNKMKGQERVAIWPGTSPTPISTTQAFMYAPLVYVDYQPQDPSKEYQARGMTLVTITVLSSGPIAAREGDLIIPGTEVAFGGFATLLGFTSTTDPSSGNDTRDVYLLGAANNGLQVARVGLDNVETYTDYSYFDPQSLQFSETSPDPNISDYTQIYLPGTFTSGSVFYSKETHEIASSILLITAGPYFSTYLMIYLNRMADSTFYVRFLDLNQPLAPDPVWIQGGKGGEGIVQEDAEALVKYAWSPQQTLYSSPPGKGGFNYAGTAHPEYFNRQYFAESLYSQSTPSDQRQNAWYGSTILSEDEAGGDGRHLLISWTSQLQGGTDNGIYQIWLAKVEFDSIPGKSTGTPLSAPSASGGTTSGGQQPSKTPENMIPNSGSRIATVFGYHGWEDSCIFDAFSHMLLSVIVASGLALLL
ncbi:hypothetical protein MMC27_004299 [Xylographa pallens]|nr:hypothetical protein [Xylographa pallens]